MNLLVSSDSIDSSGGTVTSQECEALKLIGQTEIINISPSQNPFKTDELALEVYKRMNKKFDLVHFYAGTYSKLVEQVKKDGSKVTYTAAAHDIDISKAEFEKMGFVYDYPHMTNPELFKQYVAGYKNADIVICPSMLSKNLMEKYECKKVEIIPHGCHPVYDLKPISDVFSVGYLGQIGPDKGLFYLIEAWSELNYLDSQLILAGKNSIMLLPMIRSKGKGNIFLAGFVPSISTLYNYCSVYVQPSVTEGFGMEVVEAMSYGRPVICSDGAGAVDCIKNNAGIIVPKMNSKELAAAIDFYKKNPNILKIHAQNALENSKNYNWNVIKNNYKKLWSELLSV